MSPTAIDIGIHYNTVSAAIPAFKNMIIYEMNIDTAFLNAVLVKTISMAAPDGTTVGPDECLLLKKSLYGLKQFHRKLTVDLNQCVKLMKLKHTISDV